MLKNTTSTIFRTKQSMKKRQKLTSTSQEPVLQHWVNRPFYKLSNSNHKKRKQENGHFAYLQGVPGGNGK